MGNIYIADGGNNRIVEITTAGVASVLKVTGLPSSGNTELPIWGHGGSVWESVYSGLGERPHRLRQRVRAPH